MIRHRWRVWGTSLGVCGLLLISWKGAYGRDTRVIGDLSFGYDYTERNYEAGDSGDQDEGEVPVQGVDTNVGDTRKLFIAPRVTVLSSGKTDQFQFTYSPRLNHDDLNDANDVDHDLGLRYERDVTKNWTVRVRDDFFVGDDSVREAVRRSANLDPDTEEPAPQTVGAGTEQQIVEGNLTERVGRQRFWRNHLAAETDYSFGEDSLVGGGVHYEKLDNIGGDNRAYTPYDRYHGVLRFNYRFNQKWTTDLETSYTKGDFEETTVYIVSQPAAGLSEETGEQSSQEQAEMESNNGKDQTEEDAQTDASAAETTVAAPVDIEVNAEDVSRDLQEYRLRWGLHYNWSVRDRMSLLYEYLATDYDHPLRDDVQAHQLALNWGHDFSQHLHLTLAGGPTFEKQERSSWNGDYNAHAGLLWNFYRGSFHVYADKRYTQENFNGRQDGLTDSWTAGLEVSYTIVKDLAATVFATYEDKYRYRQPDTDTNTPVVITEDQLDALAQAREEAEPTSYHEKNGSLGARISYTFGRWYTLSAIYRFTDHTIDLASRDDYQEHRFYIQLSMSHNLFRW